MTDTADPGQQTDGDSRPQTDNDLRQQTDDSHRPDGGYVTDVAVATDDANWQRLRQVGTLAVTEYRLTVRSKWAYALTGLFAIFGLMLATFSGSAVGPDDMERVVASLTNLAVYLVPLAGLAVGYDAIVGRDEQGWLAVVFSLPVTRAQVVVGTFLGRAVVLAGSTIVGFGVVGFVLLRGYGASSWPSFLWFLGAAVGVGIVFLAIAVLVSTVAREKTHALGVVLLVWLWFVLIHDLISLGIVAATSLPDVALTGLVLANPASVFRVLVLTQLGTAAGSGLDAATATTGLSTGVLVVTLLAWVVVPLVLATLAVYRRRL